MVFFEIVGWLFGIVIMMFSVVEMIEDLLILEVGLVVVECEVE